MTKKQKKQKVHSLTGRIDDRMMLRAFKAVKRNRGAAGIDKVSVGMFEANLDENLQALKKDLKNRDSGFQPKPSRRCYIPKGPHTDELRPLGIPAVRDRVAQAVLRELLNPVFEPLFHQCSFGFIQSRNCHMAIEQVLQFHAEGKKVVLDADIKGFFDNIPHDVIMQSVAAEIADGNILGLIHKFLTAGVMENGVFKPTNIGTPQGGIISPLLANIVLNHLDWQLTAAGYCSVRYADDFVVACDSKAQAQEALTLVERVVEGELGLALNRDKTEITSYGKGYDFLGYRLSTRGHSMRRKSVEKFKDKIRMLTPRHENLDAKLIARVNQVVRGTAEYFSAPFATSRSQFQTLDSWLRVRLRCMKKKRKSNRDNYKMRVKHFRKNLGLLMLEDVYLLRHGMADRVAPRYC